MLSLADRAVTSMLVGLLLTVALTAGAASAAEPTCTQPATIFCEDFESGTLNSWPDGVTAALHHLRNDPESPLPGTQALRATYPPGADGGWLTRWFMPGYDHLFGRVYVKFERGWQCGDNCTKIFAFYGNRVDDQWSGLGKAGLQPNGTDFFYAGLVTLNWYRKPDPGEVIFYSYFPDMTQAGDGHYWGNFFFQRDPREALQPGRWYCLELEVQANQPGQRDGLQRMWIDGMPKGEVTGLRWRDTQDVRINAFQLTFSGTVHQTQYVWIDNVVVSRARIGCLDAPGNVGRPDAPPPAN